MTLEAPLRRELKLQQQVIAALLNEVSGGCSMHALRR
jgi:hypothetical protein